MSVVTENDTIVALATGTGNAAIGLIRLSGPLTLGLLERFCRKFNAATDSSPAQAVPDFRGRPREALLCRVTNDAGELLDSGLVTFFPGPASYTGEDVAEIALHGNALLLRRCVELFISPPLTDDQDRARPAEPGEFTRRAFLNQKLDLSQAEAVRRLIESRSEFELRASQKLLTGQLSRLVSRFRSALISLKAETEAEVDFSTEDLTFETRDERLGKVESLLREIDEILERAAGTTRAASGFQIALMGVPNAGKSSLLNLMLGWDRAIVSEIPGTTRDYLAEEIEFEGVAVRFVDTAGLRETVDLVEAEGVRRSHSEIERSQIVLHVVDGSRPAYEFPVLPPGLSAALEAGKLTRITLINKVDVLDPTAYQPSAEETALSISCTSGQGIQDLRNLLKESIFAGTGQSDPLLLEDRHRYHFEESRGALSRALDLMQQNAPAEIIALEIDAALHHTGAITGRISEEEILGRIFSLFCVGK